MALGLLVCVLLLVSLERNLICRSVGLVGGIIGFC